MTTAEENEILKAVQRDGRLPNDVVRRLLEFHKTRREKRTRDRAETLVKRLRDRRKLSSGAAGRAGQRRDKPGPLPAPLACSPLLQLVAQATEWYGSDETPTFGPQVPGPQSDSPPPYPYHLWSVQTDASNRKISLVAAAANSSGWPGYLPVNNHLYVDVGGTVASGSQFTQYQVPAALKGVNEISASVRLMADHSVLESLPLYVPAAPPPVGLPESFGISAGTITVTLEQGLGFLFGNPKSATTEAIFGETSYFSGGNPPSYDDIPQGTSLLDDQGYMDVGVATPYDGASSLFLVFCDFEVQCLVYPVDCPYGITSTADLRFGQDEDTYADADELRGWNDESEVACAMLVQSGILCAGDVKEFRR
jgi:hypothetical protein